MSTFKVIDLATWPRRDSFGFYRTFANPSFCISVQLGAQPIRDEAHRRGDSFFLLTLYAILRAANEVPQLRQRYLDGQVIEYDELAVVTPIMTRSEAFRQVWCAYQPDFPRFRAVASPMIERAKEGEPGSMPVQSQDYLCASCVPWLHFSSGTQADLTFEQTVPILAWGKMENGTIPITCRFNHYFVDGLHFSRFFNKIQASFQDPVSLYSESKESQRS